MPVHDPQQSRIRGVTHRLGGRAARAVLVTLFALLQIAAVGCGDAPGTAKDASDLTADHSETQEDASEIDATLPWAAETQAPEGPPSLPAACSPTMPNLDQGLDLPEIPTPDGQIGMETDAAMVALGHMERLQTYAILPLAATIDVSAQGPLQVSGDAGTTVVHVSDLKNGLGELTVRFDTPGLHKLTATFGDGRVGHHWVYGYASQLPVIQLTLAPSSWQEMLDQPYVRNYHPCDVEVDGKLYPGAQVRLHGATSADLRKRSFRIKLAKGTTLPDGSADLILRSEFVDKTMLRTWMSYQAIRDFTWLPAPQTRFTHLRVNQRFYGVMHQVERLDSTYLKRRGLNPNGALYEADPPKELAIPGGSMLPLYPLEHYPLVYAKHSGATPYDDLRDLIENVLQLPHTQLVAQLDRHVKVENWLNFAAVMTVVQNQEHLRKNYYLYRNPATVDDRWMFLHWDLDVTWGHLWTPNNDVLDETIFSALPPNKGSFKVDQGFFHQMYRVLDHGPWREHWAALVTDLAGKILDPSYLKPRIDYAICLIGPDLMADPRKRASNHEYLKRVQELYKFASKRLEFLKVAVK